MLDRSCDRFKSYHASQHSYSQQFWTCSQNSPQACWRVTLPLMRIGILVLQEFHVNARLEQSRYMLLQPGIHTAQSHKCRLA